jgi:hypothetical protein
MSPQGILNVPEHAIHGLQFGLEFGQPRAAEAAFALERPQ